VARSFRICREVRTRAGVRLAPVGLPAMGVDSLSITAATEEIALMRAHLLVADTRNLVAIPEAN
jgi:hypothetical protein